VFPFLATSAALSRVLFRLPLLGSKCYLSWTVRPPATLADLFFSGFTPRSLPPVVGLLDYYFHLKNFVLSSPPLQPFQQDRFPSTRVSLACPLDPPGLFGSTIPRRRFVPPPPPLFPSRRHPPILAPRGTLLAAGPTFLRRHYSHMPQQVFFVLCHTSLPSAASFLRLTITDFLFRPG